MFSWDEPRTLREKMTKQSTGKLDDSPFHTAARAGNLVEILGILTTKEGDELKELLLKQNQAGETALYVAAEYGYADLVEEMIKYYDLVSAGIKARNGYDAFYIAAKQGDLAVVKVLWEALPELSMTVDFSNTTALHAAATEDCIDVVNFLLEVNSSLAKIARSNGKTVLHSAARLGRVEVVKALLSKEPGITTQTDKKGQTALHMAAKGYTIELVKEIVTSDPSLVNMVDNKGNTALHIATRKGRAQIVNMLLDHKGTDTKAINKVGETALDISVESGNSEIVSILREYGVQSSRAVKPGATIVRELKQIASDIKHEIRHQFEHTRQTRRHVQGIANQVNKMHKGTETKAINRVGETALIAKEDEGFDLTSIPKRTLGNESTVTEKGTHDVLYEDDIPRFVKPEILWTLAEIFSLFPPMYDFFKDDIIQLWMALGFIPLPTDETQSSTMMAVEDVARLYFEKLEQMQILQMIRLDYTTRLPRYRLSQPDWLQRGHFEEYIRIDGNKSDIQEDTLHCAILEGSIDPKILKDLYRCKKLCTLFVLHEQGSHFDQVPRELFLMLPNLRVLDLSHTNITELPSSIGNSKHLRYLNLSATRIKTLPKSLTSLYEMQTLKLRDCLKLVGLPNGMRKLINLWHLEVDVACLVVSMPPGFGDLTQLRTLPAFVVGKQNGYRITELKNMINIYGSLSILRLENVSSLEEAKESSLHRKIYLKKLELQWTESQDGFEILENLQPHTKIEELQIVGYGGTRFSSWIGNPIFSVLTTITIHDCRNCEVLPPLGKLPCLKFLCISEMNEVKVIDHQFCGRNMNTKSLDLRGLEVGIVSKSSIDVNMFRAFAWLENLTLNGMPKLERWSGMEEGDFPRLQKLNIFGCSKLTNLPELLILESIQRLEINLCPLLQHLSNKRLPTSLQCLVIIDCPLLKDWCHKEGGQHQGKLAHVPNVWVDYQQISQAMEPPEVQFEAAEKIILGLDSTMSGKAKERMIFEGDGPEAYMYLRAVDTIQRAMETASVSYDQDKVSSTIQIAMTRLEDEFRKILIIHTKSLDIESLVDPSSTESWFNAESSVESNVEDYLEDDDYTKEEKLDIVRYIHEMDLLPPEAVHNLHRIAERMISAGYLRKCIQTYVSVRKSSIDACFECLDIGKPSRWNVSGLEWGSLKEKTSRWIRAANVCVRILFASEKVLCERIFEDLGSSAGDTCFMETVKSAAIQLFKFAEAVAIHRMSPEKLFEILDLHNALLGLLPDVNVVFQSSLLESIRIQAFEMRACLIQAARGMLFEFANSLQCETSQNHIPWSRSKIHVLTEYVMNYVVYLISYHWQTLATLVVPKSSFYEEIKSTVGEERCPLRSHLIWIMMKLQNNLKGMSKYYIDASLSHFFVMDNINYMVQKVKGCPELRELIGDDYFKKLEFEIRQAAVRYQESTCMKLLPCLSEEGLYLSESFPSEVSKSALKERFKAFNQTFEETHKTQAKWVTEDLQLREDLRISVSQMLIPAYRTFLSRFRDHIESGTHPNRYIKYSVEDLESALLDFFEGVLVP